MKKIILYIIGFALIYGIYSLKDIIQGNKTFEESDDVQEYLHEIVNEKCTKNENIDRWLLQQTWFYSEKYENLAMVFDQVSFTLYGKGKPAHESINGAFCIEDNKLLANYYERTFVPVSMHIPDEGIVGFKMGTKILLGEDVIIHIKEISRKKLVLNFSDNDMEYVFFRRN